MTMILTHPPGGLDTVGKQLWRDVVADVAPNWELDNRDLTLLIAACQSADTVARLTAVIETDGDMIAGSRGQLRINPAVVEARMQRATMSSLLTRIEMAPPGVKTGHLNGRQRAHLRLAEMQEAV
jgi:P27 family predicted phage terminase small subunit